LVCKCLYCILTCLPLGIHSGVVSLDLMIIKYYCLFCFSYFSDEVLHFLPKTSLGLNHPASGVTGITYVYPVYMLVWKFANFLPELASNQNPPSLCPQSSWNYSYVLPWLANTNKISLWHSRRTFFPAS
jgi:hypothetical protein